MSLMGFEPRTSDEESDCSSHRATTTAHQDPDFVDAELFIQIGLIASQHNYFSFSVVGSGIWSGIFFGISGSIGLAAAIRPSRCK